MTCEEELFGDDVELLLLLVNAVLELLVSLEELFLEPLLDRIDEELGDGLRTGH